MAFVPLREGDTLALPFFEEPTALKELYNAQPSDVREASLRQAADIVTPIYHLWKESLRAGGITWQRFMREAARNAAAWRSWLNSELPWGNALERFAAQLGFKLNQADDCLRSELVRSGTCQKLEGGNEKERRY
jgi:hypothetical protein